MALLKPSHLGNLPLESPRRARGWLSILYHNRYSSGKLCLLRYSESRRHWVYQIPIATQFLWAIILATGLFLLPESPRYFVKKGKIRLFGAHSLPSEIFFEVERYVSGVSAPSILS